MSPRSASRKRLTLALGALIVATPAIAHADDDPTEPKVPATWGAPAAPTEPAAQPPPQTNPAKPESGVPVAAPHSEDRATGLEPKAVEPAPAKISFAADPIADGGIIIAAGTFAFLLEQINGTGEIRPQQISPNFDRSHLLGIDRGAVDQKVDQASLTNSNIGLFAAIGFAVADPILTGVREKHVQAALVDGLIYAQAIAVTFGVTNLAKIAVRRPRPAAYIEAEKHKDDPTWSNADTDSALSFFSGHASITATIGATATYLAFARAPNLWRPLITLGVGASVTAFTSMERVRGGAHFPTDVIAGALAGAGIGVIVAHLHRSEDVKQRRIWVGGIPMNDGGGAQVGGIF
jgi:membrane-associated phospholipid phosphatase